MMMKRYIIYFTAMIVSLLAASCVREEMASVGEAGDPDCYGVYFPSQHGAGDKQIDPDDPRHFTFTVSRTRATDAITVPVRIISEDEGIFTTSELRFAEDEKSAEISVYDGLRFPVSESAAL